MKSITWVSLLVMALLLNACAAETTTTSNTYETIGPRWSKQKANEWYAKQPWLVGCNFSPSTASNQLEFWQAETFDPETIDRELGWAAALGFNTVRVYLHDLVWEHDRDGFKQRIDQYLAIADAHGIKTMFVLFDDCWNHYPKIGPQPEPLPGVHNSQWVQSPGEEIVLDPSRWARLEPYMKDILSTFSGDDRILLWDLYNEPGNQDLEDKSVPFLRQIWAWAKEVRPSQPMSTCAWFQFDAIDQIGLMESDIITFHHYNDVESLEEHVARLNKLGRPLLCTEYMARTRGCTFATHMPVFKRENIAAYNWGLVAGRTNTIFQWDVKYDTPEPDVWFHDIFRKDGSAYNNEEIAYIKQMISTK